MVEFLELIEPWMIPIFVMICVTLIVAIATIGDLVKTRMKQKTGVNLAGNKEFLTALREFKQKTDQRLSNLETGASGHNIAQQHGLADKGKITERQNLSEIEFHGNESEVEPGKDGNLRNMLRQ
ncbi:MAG: hypothetical protein JJU13_01465 [Balneolaceae bacterium]|jgi:hypothetical protein|nr:hypothetical protein [Balneolaceae bacterium]